MIHHTDESTTGLSDGAGAQTRTGGLTEGQARDFGLIAPAPGGKNFVLDTNVLLHDPGCLGRFADNHLCIPVDVLAELDRFKNEQSERGANARQIHRALTELFAEGGRLTEGVETAGGGTVRLVAFDPATSGEGSPQLQLFHRIFPDRDRVDHRILACTLLIELHNGGETVLVTKDLNMQLKARAVGLTCEDYLNDKVDPRELVKRPSFFA